MRLSLVECGQSNYQSQCHVMDHVRTVMTHISEYSMRRTVSREDVCLFVGVESEPKCFLLKYGPGAKCGTQARLMWPRNS